MLNIIHWECRITLDSLEPADMFGYIFNIIIYINIFSGVWNLVNGMWYLLMDMYFIVPLLLLLLIKGVG